MIQRQSNNNWWSVSQRTEKSSAETEIHFHAVLHFHPVSENKVRAELISHPLRRCVVFVCSPIITFPAHQGPLTWAAGYQPGRQKPIIRTWLFPRLHKKWYGVINVTCVLNTAKWHLTRSRLPSYFIVSEFALSPQFSFTVEPWSRSTSSIYELKGLEFLLFY